MSLYKFVNSALSNKKINVYNKGKHIRDFTYINDVVNAVYKIFKKRVKVHIKFIILLVENLTHLKNIFQKLKKY